MDIYFVTSREAFKWKDIEQLDVAGVTVDELQERLITGIDTWVVQSFLVLKEALRASGFTVRFSQRFVPNAICIAHRDDLNLGLLPHRSYVICIRADRAPVCIANQVVVQNQTIGLHSGAVFLPFWPQPGLIRRSAERGDKVQRIGYLGRINYLPPELTFPQFKSELAALGVELTMRHRGWHDYREIDAVLAIRRQPAVLMATKLASKLINAWHAGVPALLGPEPAYDEIRRSDLDYLPIDSPASVLAAIRRLQSEPGLFAAMVANGRMRSLEFSRKAVAQRWLDFIHQVVVPDYGRWLRGNLAGWNPLRFAQFLLAMGRQHTESRRFKARECEEFMALGAPTESGIGGDLTSTAPTPPRCRTLGGG